MRSLMTILVLAVAALAPSAAASDSGSKPRLVVLDRAPIAVRGLHFKAGEDVRVRAIVRGGQRVTKWVEAGRSGVFNARFSSLQPGRCAFVTIVATGARGSRAVYTLHPPLCPAQ